MSHYVRKKARARKKKLARKSGTQRQPKAAVKKPAVKKAAVKKAAANRRTPPKKRAAKKAAKKRGARPAVRRPAKKAAAKKLARKQPKKLTATQKRSREQKRLQARFDKLRKQADKLREQLRKAKRAKKPAKRVVKQKDKKLKDERKKIRPKKPILDKKLQQKLKEVAKLAEEDREVVLGKTGNEWLSDHPKLEFLRKRFKQLREEAQKKGVVSRPPDRRKKRYRTQDTQGQMRIITFGQGLDLHGNVEEIMSRVRAAANQMRPIFDIWMTDFVMTSYGERIVGSGQNVLVSNQVDAHLFNAGFDSSGAWNSREAMLDHLESTLQGYAEEPATIVRIEWARVRNFSGWTSSRKGNV